MKLTIFVSLALFGFCVAESSYPKYDSYDSQYKKYNGYRHGHGINDIDDVSSEAKGSFEYKNPYPYVPNVWGPAYPENVQQNAESMEWQHNKILRELTRRFVQARKAEEQRGPVRNFTTGVLVSPPEEQHIERIFVNFEQNDYTFEPVQTFGLKTLNNGAQYMVADYEKYTVNLTFNTQREIHLKGEYDVQPTPAKTALQKKPYDIWTKSGGTKFTVMFRMVGEQQNGVYYYDSNVKPECVFEPVNGYDHDKNFPTGKSGLMRQLYQKVANHFCSEYISHPLVQEKINYLLQWNSPSHRYNSVLDQGMNVLMKNFTDQVKHPQNDLGQGYTIKYCGYNITFTNIRGLESEEPSNKGYQILYPSTHQDENDRVVTEVSGIILNGLTLELTAVFDNGTGYNHVYKFAISVNEPIKTALTFVKHYNNENESIHLGYHPDVTVGGTHDATLSAIQDPHFRKILQELKPVYHSVISASFIGFLQHRLFNFLYPTYSPNAAGQVLNNY